MRRRGLFQRDLSQHPAPLQEWLNEMNRSDYQSGRIRWVRLPKVTRAEVHANARWFGKFLLTAALPTGGSIWWWHDQLNEGNPAGRGVFSVILILGVMFLRLGRQRRGLRTSANDHHVGAHRKQRESGLSSIALLFNDLHPGCRLERGDNVRTRPRLDELSPHSSRHENPTDDSWNEVEVADARKGGEAATYPQRRSCADVRPGRRDPRLGSREYGSQDGEQSVNNLLPNTG